jgi:hypothetical protein
MLPGHAAQFALLARIPVGPTDGPRVECDITVCALSGKPTHACKAGGISNARHHLVVNFGDFDDHY